uniref:Mitochondrial basic amino acids transporter n=2 Tax=Clastoptera arizonana TaxID=38151 RepID=A0A1B6DEN6_9HEMI
MALDFIAGCLGGCAGVLVGHPLDTIKVRIQTQDFRNPLYKGTWDCFQKIVKQESISGLYKGMSSPMAGVAVVNAVVFGVYGNVQRKLPDPESLKSYFIAGACAGLGQSVIASPMEMVKTRLQIQKTLQYKNPVDCIVKIARSDGYRGVFKGLNITGVREFFGYGIYFSTYEALTRRTPEQSPISTFHMLLAGGLSGSASWIVTYPLDVIKSRLQADGMSGVMRYSGVVDCLKKSIAEEGYACLVRGLTPTLIRAFPTNAVTFTVVTWIFRLANVGEKEEVTIDGLLDAIPNNNLAFKEYHVIEPNVAPVFNLVQTDFMKVIESKFNSREIEKEIVEDTIEEIVVEMLNDGVNTADKIEQQSEIVTVS